MISEKTKQEFAKKVDSLVALINSRIRETGGQFGADILRNDIRVEVYAYVNNPFKPRINSYCAWIDKETDTIVWGRLA